VCERELIRPWCLEDAYGGGLLVVECAAEGVIPSAQLHPGDVPHVSAPTRAIGSDNDVAELLFALEAAMDVHDQLERGRRGDRLGPDDPTGHLHVLLANGVHHVTGHQAAACQLRRIQPDAHRIVARAEDRRLTHPGDARQAVFQLKSCIVAQVQRVVSAIGREEADPHHECRRALDRRHAERADNVWEAWQRLRHPVLHLHLRDVGIRADLEGHREREASVGLRLR
jgi:hypothetical protein